MSWTFTEKAIEFLQALALERSKPCYIEFIVKDGGTPTAQLSVNFAQSFDSQKQYQKGITEGLAAVCDLQWCSVLEDMSVDYVVDDQGGGELEIQAPKLYGNKSQWTLVEKLNQFITAEISPYLESHNGNAKVVEVNGRNEAILEFAGGCQGCSMAQVTLKTGIEKKIKEKFPEITQVIDFTDHQKGENPYYSDIAD